MSECVAIYETLNDNLSDEVGKFLYGDLPNKDSNYIQIYGRAGRQPVDDNPDNDTWYFIRSDKCSIIYKEYLHFICIQTLDRSTKQTTLITSRTNQGDQGIPPLGGIKISNLNEPSVYKIKDHCGDIVGIPEGVRFVATKKCNFDMSVGSLELYNIEYIFADDLKESNDANQYLDRWIPTSCCDYLQPYSEILNLTDFYDDIGNVSLSDEERDAIFNVINRGIMKGFDNKFRPNDTVTRKELAIIISRLLDSIGK